VLRRRSLENGNGSLYSSLVSFGLGFLRMAIDPVILPEMIPKSTYLLRKSRPMFIGRHG